MSLQFDPMGYSKRDGRPQDGSRSELLQVRIGTVERDVLKDVCSLEGLSVSEFVRQAIYKHAQLVIADFNTRNQASWEQMQRRRAHHRQGSLDLPVKDMTDTYDLDAFLPRPRSADAKKATQP